MNSKSTKTQCLPSNNVPAHFKQRAILRLVPTGVILEIPDSDAGESGGPELLVEGRQLYL